jgi:outer membrane protein assembly factor BamB
MVGSIARRTFLRTGAAGLMAAAAGCFGPEQDGVYALARTDGSERWVNKLGPVDSGPVVGDGTVFVGSGQTVHAIATADGDQLWSYDVEFEYTNDIKDPWLWNGTVLVPAGKELYALSATDGSEEWTFVGDAELWLVPRPADGIVVVGSGKTRLHGISIEDGAERWTYEGEALDKNGGSVVDGTAYVGSRNGRLIALDVSDGTERWTFGTDKAVRGHPAVHGGRVFAATTGQRVHALSTESGSEHWRWDQPPGSPITPLFATWPATMGLDQTAYAAHAGRLFALDARDGSENWRAKTDLTSMELHQSGETIYVSGGGLSSSNRSATSYGAVGAYDRRDGRERWSKTLAGDELEGHPAVAENAVFAGTDAGVVHAIDKRDGSEAWSAETGADTLHGPAIDGETVYVGTER